MTPTLLTFPTAQPVGPTRVRETLSHAAPRRLQATPIAVREARSRSEIDQFVRFPWRIYERDPYWAPPLLMERKAFLDPRQQPFLRHGAKAQFLAYRNRQVVGRILVSDDPHYNAQHGTNLGCFGMFECVDNSRVADSLLKTARDWLRARGREQIMGPIDYSTNYACGLLVDGFEFPQRVMMNHNPRYYVDLLEGANLTKAKDLYAWWFDDSGDLLARWRQTADRLAARGGVTIRPMRMDDFENEVRKAREVYNGGWEQSWGFVKMTDEEFTHLARQLRQFADPGMLLLAEVAGQPVGICLTLPDLNQALRHINGRLTTWGLPIGLARLAWESRKINTGRMAVLGVLPQYRKRGVSELLILRALDYGKNRLGYWGAELGWTLEDNDLINRTIEKVGARRYKTYRLYEQAI